jgi:hypothetical protein
MLSPCGIRASLAQVAKQKLLLEKEEKKRAEWVEKCEQLRQLGRRPVKVEALYDWFMDVRCCPLRLTDFRRTELDKALPGWNENVVDLSTVDSADKRAEWVAKCEQLRQLGRRQVSCEALYDWFMNVRCRLDRLTDFRRTELDKALPGWNEKADPRKDLDSAQNCAEQQEEPC